MSYINEEVDGVLYTVDGITGEVKYPEIIETKYKKVVTSKKYVGIDTPFVNNCTNRAQLLETIQAIDHRHDMHVSYNADYVLMSMTDGISAPVRKVLLYLVKSIVAWNHVFTTTAELNSVVDRRVVASCLNELCKHGVLWEVNKSGTKYHIKFNALVAWKGGYNFKEDAITQFYTPETNPELAKY